MGKHRAEAPEPLRTLATSRAPSDAPQPDPQYWGSFVTPVAATSTPPPSASAAVAPPATDRATSSPGTSPIPAPVLTTPRRSRLEVATPTTVKVACWTAVVMWSLHALGYAAVAVEISSLRGETTAGKRVDGLLPGQSIAADAGGMLTLWALLAGLAALACLVAVALAVVTLKRSAAARIGVIIASGAAGALSLGPVFGDGSLWWLATLFAAGLTGGLLAWDG